MGQRLVIELIDGNENTIAAVYYHWSAYFGSTIAELATLSKDILKAKKDKKDILPAVLDGLERRGGGLGVNPRNYAEAQKRFPGRTFKQDISRNDGLLYLGEEEIKETIDMAEGLAAIYIDLEEVTNDVTYLTYSEYLDVDYGEGYTVIDGKRIDISADEMTMEECIRLNDFFEEIFQEKMKKYNQREAEKV